MLAATSAKAGWVTNDFVFGSGSYISYHFSMIMPVSSSVITGADLGFYSKSDQPDVVYALKIPTFIAPLKTVIRPFYYPSTHLIKSTSGGFLAQKEFSLYADDNAKEWTSMSLNAGFAAQRSDSLNSDGITAIRTLPEASYEMQIQQNFYREFFLSASAGVYQYFSPVQGRQNVNASMDQGELIYMGTRAAITDLPKYTAGINFLRNDGGEDKGTGGVYAGYHYTAFMEPRPILHAITVGARAEVMENTMLDFNYDWLASPGRHTQNFYGMTLRMKY